MVEDGPLWKALPRPLRELPADLAAVIVLVVATNLAVFAPVLRESQLRIPLGLVFVLFVPGYAFVTALFPESGASPTVNRREGGRDEEVPSGAHVDTRWSEIDGLERIILSIGLSIAIVPLFGLVLNYTPFGIQLTPIAVAVSGFTLVMTGVAAVRRRKLPTEEQFRIPYREWYSAGRAGVFGTDTRADAMLNVFVVVAILLAVASVGYAAVGPTQGEQFSAVYILTEDDNGELVAEDYPTEFAHGESQELVVGVDNHEQRTVEYSVVAVEQTVEIVENETVIEDQRELDRFNAELAHNETWRFQHDLEPTMTGEDVRVVWLLYPGEVPADPSMETTEHHVHLWVDTGE